MKREGVKRVKGVRDQARMKAQKSRQPRNFCHRSARVRAFFKSNLRAAAYQEVRGGRLDFRQSCRAARRCFITTCSRTCRNDARRFPAPSFPYPFFAFHPFLQPPLPFFLPLSSNGTDAFTVQDTRPAIPGRLNVDQTGSSIFRTARTRSDANELRIKVVTRIYEPSVGNYVSIDANRLDWHGSFSRWMSF